VYGATTVISKDPAEDLKKTSLVEGTTPTAAGSSVGAKGARATTSHGGGGGGGGGGGDASVGGGSGGGGDGDGGGGLGDGDGGGEGGDEGGIIPTNLWMALSSAAWSFSIVSSFACMNPSSSKHVQVDGGEPARDPEPSTVAAPNLGAGDDIKVAAPTQSSMQKAARYLRRRGLIICGCREGVRRALYIGKREGIQLRFVCERACRFWACFSRRGLFRACFSPATDDENCGATQKRRRFVAGRVAGNSVSSEAASVRCGRVTFCAGWWRRGGDQWSAGTSRSTTGINQSKEFRSCSGAKKTQCCCKTRR
jgi:hypothetical protein